MLLSKIQVKILTQTINFFVRWKHKQHINKKKSTKEEIQTNKQNPHTNLWSKLATLRRKKENLNSETKPELFKAWWMSLLELRDQDSQMQRNLLRFSTESKNFCLSQNLSFINNYSPFLKTYSVARDLAVDRRETLPAFSLYLSGVCFWFKKFYTIFCLLSVYPKYSIHHYR